MTAVSDVLSPSAYTPDADTPPPVAARAPWHPITRLAFCVAFVYFGLYVLLTQMMPTLFGIPGVDVPNLEQSAPVRAIVVWVGTHILGLAEVSIAPSGSGDKTFDWVQAFTIAVTALIAGSIWFAKAGERVSNERLFAWFRLGLRLAVGTTLLSYGFAKVIPLQMPAPSLGRLLQPFGTFSPMGVLWSSIGASTSYEVFVGTAEAVGGLLVMIPRTAKIGVLICLADAIEVFVLNMTYDVPVKLFSFHLVLMSLVLLAPDARRLFNLLLLGRTDQLRPEPQVAKTLGGQRGAAIAQTAFALYTLGFNIWGSTKAWTQYGGGVPKPPLYGIWEVREMSVGGVTLPPLFTDTTRWRRAIFQSSLGMAVYKMNDSTVVFRTTVDTVAHTIVLSSFADSTKPKQTLTYARPDPTRLVFDGMLDGQPLHVDMTFRDPDSFPLRSRGFHWVQERPFNR